MVFSVDSDALRGSASRCSAGKFFRGASGLPGLGVGKWKNYGQLV